MRQEKPWVLAPAACSCGVGSAIGQCNALALVCHLWPICFGTSMLSGKYSSCDQLGLFQRKVAATAFTLKCGGTNPEIFFLSCSCCQDMSPKLISSCSRCVKYGLGQAHDTSGRHLKDREDTHTWSCCLQKHFTASPACRMASCIFIFLPFSGKGEPVLPKL